MGTVPIPQGAEIGEPEAPAAVPIPQGAQIGEEEDQDVGSTGFESYGQALQTPEGRAAQTQTLKGLAPGAVGGVVSSLGGPLLGGAAYLATKGLVSPEEVAAHPVSTALETASFPAFEYGTKAIGGVVGKLAKYFTGEGIQNDLKAAIKTVAGQSSEAGTDESGVVYRARDVGEKGVPTGQHAQATSSLEQAQRYSQAGQRSPTQGEVVKIDLNKLDPKDYVVKQHPDGMNWVEFTRPLRENEVEPLTAAKPPVSAATARKSFEEAADSVYAKSKGTYARIDSATGGKFQSTTRALQNVDRKLADIHGTNPDQEGALIEQRNQLEDVQNQMWEEAKQKGVDPTMVDSAKANYKRAMALYDLDRQVKMSTSGVEPITSETVDPKKLSSRLERLYDTGRLQEAVGEKGAAQMLKESHAAEVRMTRLKAVKKGAGIVGKAAAGGGIGGAAAGAGYAAYKAVTPE